MDKYEYRIRAEEINALIEKKQFVEAVKIADTIDWSRVKSVMMLCKVSELYKYVRRFEDAKEILLLAYDRQPGGRKIVYSLCELSIKLEETVQAVEYYKEFVQVAPTDTRRFILQYRLYEAQDVSLEERIAVLEEYKKRDYREKWAYELAYLYHRIGLATRCVEECDELILWFGEGKYVNMAMELKMLHAPLSSSQQEKYDRRFIKEEPQDEVDKEPADQTLSIEIKAVDVTKAKTTEIISDSVREALNAADTIEVPDLNASSDHLVEENKVEESFAESQPEEELTDEKSSSLKEDVPEEIPLVDPDLDIQVKTVDVGEYNTINLQQELAQNISRMFAEEDMEAADATMALPIESILNTTSQRGRVIQSISDEAIKDAILAPLLQDTEESTQITEEDLLASLAQERLKKEEAERLEAERLEAEKKEAERLEAERREAERQETARLEAEKIEAERREAERLEAERLEAERQEAERREAERQEAERLEAERQEAERQEAERREAERREAERQEAERLEAERQEAERREAERREAERLEAERLEAERQEAERQEAERLEAERLEAERLEAERQEAERQEAERQEAERREAERREAERLEAERLEAERQEAERREAERQEAERREAERREAERQEAERREAERQEAERLEAATPVTAGAIMAAEIAHAVTTGNTGSLNIGSPKFDTGNISLDGKISTGDPMIDEQISGQLSLLDIMNEWEETKKANEEKRIAQMREKVLKQTGPMFSNFDEVARASVATNLDLINPVVDVFKQSNAMQEQSFSYENEVSSKDEEQEIPQALSAEGSEEQEISRVSSIGGSEEPRKALNTEEINGLEEKLLEVLKKTETQQEDQEISTFVPDLEFKREELKQEQEPDHQERVIIAEEVETKGASILAAMMENHTTDAVQQAPVSPLAETVVTPQVQQEPVSPVAETVVTPQVQQEPVSPVAETVVTPQVQQAPVSPVAETVVTPQVQQAPVSPVVETVITPQVQQAPVSPLAETVVTPQVQQAPVVQPAVQVAQPLPPTVTASDRLLTKEEKELLGKIAPIKELQIKVAHALDAMSLTMATGNVLVTGDRGIDRISIAKNVVKCMQMKDPVFSGKVAKIKGDLFSTKDVAGTLTELENGALIIEEAGSIESDILANLLYYLDRLNLNGILVILEDTKEAIEKLIHTYPQMNQIFSSKIEIEVLDNDGLVQFAKTYANSLEYSIDEMGVLAIYTRISDMQTNEHAVTIKEVKCMVNDAIDHAEKKNVKHFVDVLFGKRFDDEDMIILRENDFSIE